VNDCESQNSVNNSQSFTKELLLTAQHRRAQSSGGLLATAELLFFLTDGLFNSLNVTVFKKIAFCTLQVQLQNGEEKLYVGVISQNSVIKYCVTCDFSARVLYIGLKYLSVILLCLSGKKLLEN